MSISDCGVIVYNGVESSLVVEFKEKKDSDPIFPELKGVVHNQRVEVFFQRGYGVLRYQGRLCVPDVGELRKHIFLQKPITLGILFIQVPLICTAICGKSIGGMA